MKLSLLADAFRVWNILILRVHEQAAPETQHIYQHSHLLPTLLLSQHKDSSRTSSSFLHLSHYPRARAAWQDPTRATQQSTDVSSFSSISAAAHCPQDVSHEYSW